MIIADGYNVIYKWECLKKYLDDIDLARLKLINILANYQGYTGEDVIVVFDSSMRETEHFLEDAPENIKVIFAPNSKGADLYIEQLVGSLNDLQNVTVITGDNVERTAVMRLGAHTLSPERFEREVVKIVKNKGGI